MEVVARLKDAAISAQKARLVADEIRGLPLSQALSRLKFTPKKGAALLLKVLESAMANAEHNDGADIDVLRVSKVCIDEATSLKRFSARAKGRANRITKRRCHINIFLADAS